MTMELTIKQTREMLTAMCDAIVANVDVLTKADQAIGDGDHGVGMSRGFKAAKEAIAEAEAASVGDLFKAGGSAIMATSGGASGVIFGMFLKAPARTLTGDMLDAAGYANWLAAAAAQIQTRGKAKPGDKTMVDAVVPAAEAAEEAVSKGLLAVAEAAAAGAHRGKDDTVDMIATFGKAKALGERAKGHPDPGALSTTILLDTALGYIKTVA
jgi:dihydroxyacetone kinase-like protein